MPAPSPRAIFGCASWGLIFPILSLAALLAVLAGARARRDGVPFAMTVAFFVTAFLTLGVMFWPYMIPYALTVADAAAPEASLRFFFYGGIVVLPVIARLHDRGVLGLPRKD